MAERPSAMATVACSTRNVVIDRRESSKPCTDVICIRTGEQRFHDRHKLQQAVTAHHKL